ncbi:MAG: DUF3795 domain-containing protein [Bacillales bacterium]|nr:DUF3795 domain-containing protein [Bacillales bacterium]
MKNILIAYCGLNCEECDAYKATINNDDELREKVAKEWSILNGIEITKEMINCEGCRTEGKKTPFCDKLCPIRNCTKSKMVNTCGDCEKLRSCVTIKMIIDHNDNALNNLLKK